MKFIRKIWTTVQKIRYFLKTLRKYDNKDLQNYRQNKVGDERTRQEIGDAPTHPPVPIESFIIKIIFFMFHYPS